MSFGRWMDGTQTQEVISMSRDGEDYIVREWDRWEAVSWRVDKVGIGASTVDLGGLVGSKENR